MTPSGPPAVGGFGGPARPADGPGTEPPGDVGSSPAVVRRGTADDAADVAAVHAARISEGFLSLLGTGFLRLLYGRITQHDPSFLLVAEQDGRTVGFIAGSADVAGLYRSFLRHDGLRAAVGSAGPLLRGWRRVLETLRHGTSAGARTAGEAELLAVAVDAGSQARGAGRQLVASFLAEARSRDCHAARVVVGAGNHRAIALYEGVGFVPVRRFELHPGTESLVMRWGPPAPASASGSDDR